MEEKIKDQEKVSLYIFRKENDKKEMVSKIDIDIGKKYTIGRKKNKADIVLEDLAVSRIHLELTFINNQKILIKDLGSNNGTFINGEQIPSYKEYNLTINDSLFIGKISNEISFEDLKKEQEDKIKESDEKNNINKNKNQNYLNEKKENKNEENKNIINNKIPIENIIEEKKINELQNINDNRKSSDSKLTNNYYSKNSNSPQKQYRRKSYSKSKSRSRSRARERSRDRERERDDYSYRKSKKRSSDYNKNKKYSKDSDSYKKTENVKKKRYSKSDSFSNNSRSRSEKKKSLNNKNNKYKTIPSYIIKKEDNKEKVNEKDLRQIILYKEYLQIKKETSLPKLLPVLISRKEDDNFKPNNISFKNPISTGMTKFLKRGLQATFKKNYYGNYYSNY